MPRMRKIGGSLVSFAGATDLMRQSIGLIIRMSRTAGDLSITAATFENR